MEFGRVPDIGGIDLSLPADDAKTAAVLAAGRGGGRARVHIGCPVWNDAALARKFMPKGAPASDRLVHYASAFPCIELNASGYGLDPLAAARWAESTPKGFLFCPKVPMEISHGENPAGSAGAWAWAAFTGAARAFGDRLGPAFLQFPDSFGPSRLRELETLLRAHASPASGRDGLDLAVELRHPAWFNDARRRESLFGLLAELKIASVITDTPGRRDVLHQRLTMPWAFVRFMGHDMSPKDVARLDDWARRFKAWLDAGLERIFFFFHHAPVVHAAEWCLRLTERLNEVCGLELPPPRLEDRPKKKIAPGGVTQGDLFG